MDWNWDWAIGGITDETPRTMGPECENYLTDRRRWTESVLLCTFFVCVIKFLSNRIEPIQLPDAKELEKPHTPARLMLLIFMTFIFGIEMGFKLANRNVIYVLNPCHIQTLVQIYLLAAKPNKFTITLFRIQMNNLNGPFLAFIFPEVETRTLPFEQATYWIQHAMLCVITAYILRTGAYKVEDIKDFKWSIIGVEAQLMYCFGILNFFSIKSGININKMLCADESDPFQGDNYRIAAVFHETLLCPMLNKLTVLIFSTPASVQQHGSMKQNINSIHPQKYANLKSTIPTTLYEKYPPSSKETTYICDDKIINRKSNCLNYEKLYTTQSPLLQKASEVGNETTALEADHLDMEVIESSSTTATTEAEYSLHMTKID